MAWERLMSVDVIKIGVIYIFFMFFFLRDRGGSAARR